MKKTTANLRCFMLVQDFMRYILYMNVSVLVKKYCSHTVYYIVLREIIRKTLVRVSMLFEK